MPQASGGAAGNDAAERDGQWPLPVSALRGGAGLPGQCLCLLQRLQEGKPCSSLAHQLPSTGQLCHPMALHPSFQDSVCTHVCMCTFMYVVISFAVWEEGTEDGMAWLLEIALGRRVRAWCKSCSYTNHSTSGNWSGVSCLVFSIWNIGATITCTPGSDTLNAKLIKPYLVLGTGGGAHF